MSVGEAIDSVTGVGGLGDKLSEVLAGGASTGPKDVELVCKRGVNIDGETQEVKVPPSQEQSAEPPPLHDRQSIDFILFGRVHAMAAAAFTERGERLRDALMREAILLHTLIHDAATMQRELKTVRGAVGAAIAVASKLISGSAAAEPSPHYLDELLGKVVQVWDKLNQESISYKALYEAGAALHQQRLNFRAHLWRCLEYYIAALRQAKGVHGLLPTLPALGWTGAILEALPWIELLFKPLEVSLLAYFLMVVVHADTIEEACLAAAKQELTRKAAPTEGPSPQRFAIWFPEVPPGTTQRRRRDLEQRKKDLESDWQGLKGSLLSQPSDVLNKAQSMLHSFFAQDASRAPADKRELLDKLFLAMSQQRNAVPFILLDSFCAAAGVLPKCVETIRTCEGGKLDFLDAVRLLGHELGFSGQLIVGVFGLWFGQCGEVALLFLQELFYLLQRHGADTKIDEFYILPAVLDRLFEFLKDQLNKRVPQIFTMMRAASLDLQGGTLLSAEQLEQLLLAVANEKLRPVCCSMLSWTVSQLCEQLEALRGEAVNIAALTLEWFLGSLPLGAVVLARYLFFPLWPALLRALAEKVDPHLRVVMNLIAHHAGEADNALRMGVGMVRETQEVIQQLGSGVDLQNAKKFGQELGDIPLPVERYKQRRAQAAEDEADAEKKRLADKTPSFAGAKRVTAGRTLPVDPNDLPTAVAIAAS